MGERAMSGREWAASILMVLILVVGALAVVLHQDYRKGQLLESRVVEYYEHIVNGRYEELWEMGTPSFKEDTPKDEYANMARQSMDMVEFNYESPQVADRTGDYAFTTAEITVVSEDTNWRECEKILWGWRGDNWYFALTNLICTAELTPEEIKMRTKY